MISSVHNPKIQMVRKLQTRAKARNEEEAFIIEGMRLAEEALRAGWEAQLVLYAEPLDERSKAVVDSFSMQGVPIEVVSEAVMKAISETETPQGLLVVLPLRTLPLPINPDFVLILDNLRDPGNLGTILRTAAAAGAQMVYLSPGCADAWSPKVVRSGMGAHFHLPMLNLGWQEIRQNLRKSNDKMRVYLADVRDGIPYQQADLRGPTALIVGGEATGAGAEADLLADSKVHIRMPGASESLNAAIAVGILLFEVVRQRTR